MSDSHDARVRPSLSQVAFRVARAALASPLLSHRLLVYASAVLLILGVCMARPGPVAYLALALAAFWLAQRMPATAVRQLGLVIVGLAVILLAVRDLLPILHSAQLLDQARIGPIRGQAQWLHIGPVAVAPADLAKLGLALWLADVMARTGPTVRTPELAARVLPMAALLSLLVGLHDGADLLPLWAIVTGALFAMPVPRTLIVAVVVIALAGMMVSTLYAAVDIEKALLAACGDAYCHGVMQSRAAIVEGGWFGLGLGHGVADRFPFSNEQFVLAEVADELGAVGCLTVLAASAVIGYAGYRVARRVRDPFRRVAASALTSWLVVQAAANVGGVLGALPVTALPLPLVSVPDARTVTTMAALGVLAGFARAEPDASRALHADPPPRWLRKVWAPLPPRA